ncbi:MAG: nuclease-related domain-containing protein [bacterium]|jgi:hypothetical protein
MAVVLRDINSVKRARNIYGALFYPTLPLAIFMLFRLQGWWRLLVIIPMAVALISFRFYFAYHSGLNMERKVGNILKDLPGDNVYVLHDLQFEHAGQKAKIMHLAITPRGIFNIETRHRQGKIVDEGEKWHHYWVNDHNIIDSPVNRAAGNAEILREIVRAGAADIFPEAEFVDQMLIQSVVVFTSENVELKIMSSKIPVFKLGEFEKYINSFRKRIDLVPEVRKKLAHYILRRSLA